MIVGDELWSLVLRSVGENEGGEVTQDDDGAGHQEENLLPHLPAVISVGTRHLSELQEKSLNRNDLLRENGLT